MQKTLKRVLTFLLCLSMMSSVVSVAFAVSVGKVGSIKASSVTTTSMKISWSAVKKASGYRLYEYNYSSKSWSLLKQTTSTSFSDKGILPGTRCAYKVRAYIISGGKKTYGSYSSILYALTKSNDVASFKATSSTSNSVSLSWKTALGAAGYRVYLYNPTLKKYEKVTDTTKTEYTVKGLSPNTTYAFKVRSFAKSGSLVSFGNTSAGIKYKTKIETVSGFKLTDNSGSSFSIAWNSVKGATGYQLLQYDSLSKIWKVVQNSTETTYNVNELESGTKYSYKVRAYLTSSGSTQYSPYSSTLVACSTPSAPENLKAAVNSDNGISLTWDSVVGATGYQIFSYDSSNGTWVYYKAVSTNSFNDNDLPDTKTYTYKLRAYIKGTSAYYYSDFCESTSLFFESTKKPNSIYPAEMAAAGVLGYLYDPIEGCFYTSDDAWQRNFGFNEIYDIAAPFTMLNYDTIRLKFTSGNKDWMIQLWKGQYGLVFYGGEVGVYTKPTSRTVEHYDAASDDDMLKMSLQFYEKKFSLFKGWDWKQTFERPYGIYWWCTGFLPGNKGFTDYSELKLKIRITMKNFDMLNGFEKALQDAKIDYTVSGLDVRFEYVTE